MQYLARYLKAAKMSQSELARRSGVPQPMISMMIKGTRPISLNAAKAFEDASNGALRATVLLGLEPEPQPAVSSETGIPQTPAA